MGKRTDWFKLLNQIKIPLGFVLLIWGIEIYEEVSGSWLGRYGIYPRDGGGLLGIITAPLIHNDWEHLFSNSAPLLVLGSVMAIFYKRVANISFLLIYLLSGFGVWLFARPSYHIGASGVVYGLISWVLWTGIFRRNIKSVVLALITVVLYAGYEQGLLPNEEGISFESHLSGAIVGIICAFAFKNHKEKDEKERDPWANEDKSTQAWLAPDTFEKTKAQRRYEAWLAQQKALEEQRIREEMRRQEELRRQEEIRRIAEQRNTDNNEYN